MKVINQYLREASGNDPQAIHDLSSRLSILLKQKASAIKSGSIKAVEYLKKEISKYQNTLGQTSLDLMRNNPGTTAAAAIGSVALIASSVYIYRRFLSKAARACSQYSGLEKDECMQMYKVRAAEQAIAHLKASKQFCKYRRNQFKCIDAIDKKIAEWNMRIRKAREKIAKYHLKRYEVNV